jgi:hypothetical protein
VIHPVGATPLGSANSRIFSSVIHVQVVYYLVIYIFRRLQTTLYTSCAGAWVYHMDFTSTVAVWCCHCIFTVENLCRCPSSTCTHHDYLFVGKYAYIHTHAHTHVQRLYPFTTHIHIFSVDYTPSRRRQFADTKHVCIVSAMRMCLRHQCYNPQVGTQWRHI